jgi:hypothetical protein
MGRTTFNVGKPGFILGSNYDTNDGRQIDFDRVPDSFKNADAKKEVPAATVVSEVGSGKVVPRSSTKGTVSNLTQSAGTATATQTAHGYETGDVVTISGATQAEYNGDHQITVVDADTYTFAVDSGATTPATGTITAHIKATAILLATAIEGDDVDAISGHGVVLGGVIFKNLLEEDDNSDFDTWLSELKEAGTGFVFETYSDNRSS